MKMHHPSPRARSGFSLIEILFAIFILGIGLLMVAAVFPVAIKWTNQDVQSTVGLVIARGAVAQVKVAEQAGQPIFVSEVGTTIPATFPQPYFFGTPNPTVSICTTAAASAGNGQARYWWQGVLVPQLANGSSNIAPTANAQTNTYTLYIFVFSKGDPNNNYYPQTTSATATTTPYPSLYVAQFSQTGTPGNSATGYLPIGAMALDLNTGATIRKQVITPYGSTTPTVSFAGSGGSTSDGVVFAPPAINQQASPLVYIYATTVTF